MSTLKVDSIQGYSGADVSITGSVSQADNLTSGDKTFDATLNFQESRGINLYEYSFGAGETPSFIRWYSGSGGSNYINMQNEPNGNGRVTISAFPANDHFVFFDPNTHITEFDGEISGYLSNKLRISGDALITGSLDQQFTAPGNFQQKNFATVTGATVNSDSYTNVFYGFADYTSFGNNFSDYFTIEYYDGFGYNFGSEFNVNGIQTRLATFASGSGAGAEIKTTDNGDTTSKVTLRSDSGQIIVTTLGDYADDTAAASGGVPVNGMYRSGSQLMIRVS